MPTDAVSSPSDPVPTPVGSTAPPAYSRRRVAKNILGLTGLHTVIRFLTVVINIYVRRVLGPGVIGMISWNTAVISYLTLLTNPGMQTIAKRDVARDPSRSTDLLSLRLTAQALLTIPAFLIAMIIALSGIRGELASTLLMVQALTLFVHVISIQWLPEAHERVIFPTAVAMVTQAVQVPLLLWLVRSPDNAMAFVAYTIPLNIGAALVVAWYCARTALLRLSDLRPRLKGFWELTRESWPLTISAAAITVYYNSDAVILGFVATNEVVGHYTTAYITMLVPMIFHTILWQSYLPALSRTADDPVQRSVAANEFMKMCVWIGFPLAAMGWAVGRHVMVLLMGSGYVPSGPYFEWLCLDLALIFFNHGAASPLMLWGWQKTHLKMTVCAGIVNLLLNLVLIPIYGPWGAVATTLAAEAVVMVWAIVVRRRISPLPAGSILQALIWFAVVAAAAKYIAGIGPHRWWIAIAVGTVMTGSYWWYVLGRRLLSRLPGRVIERGS